LRSRFVFKANILLNYALSLTQDLAGAHRTMHRQAEIHTHKYTLTGWWAPARFLDSCGEPYSRETCFLTSDATVLWETQNKTKAHLLH